MDEIIKEYSNDELTIVWKPGKCIHSGICVKLLPEVYNPKDKPWIRIKNTDTQQLKDQIAKCPSGALSYYMNDQNNKESKSLDTRVEVLPNGPLLIYGTLKVQDKEGNIEVKNKTTAFCRCGASNNKPYCDGSHLKVNFKD
ncbi:(4Fe-4S)-binding protein [Zhouia spongiae]|uniref:(4Fe-4S)-binding protein n=1 Tax=Zhouia spongiae TaxID=2202721 RepID=A0ABY3YIZ4_9FLAO|nr:(4Fe-4S)-binding protein [Zhouia spongiae]UNY97616.1 (4Fe-4S)-binding protein [Zhouia spongiae]